MGFAFSVFFLAETDYVGTACMQYIGMMSGIAISVAMYISQEQRFDACKDLATHLAKDCNYHKILSFLRFYELVCIFHGSHCICDT